MLAILCSTPRPPLGVGLLGLLITAISSTLHLLPYIIFCGIIVLSIWVPSRPADPKVVYYPVDGYSQYAYVVYTSDATPPADENGSFELNACLGVLLFLLSIPVTSILENLLIRPTRDLFLQTVECWFDMRYVQPLLATGSWPDTWTPVLNTLRSFPFIADFIDGVMGNDDSSTLTREKKVRWADLQPPTPGRDIGGCSGTSSRTHSAVQKTSSSCRAVHREGQRKLDRKRTSSPDTVVPMGIEHSSSDPLPRKTFISPPRALPSPSWNRDPRASFLISKDLSGMIGVFLRHPSRFKPVPRPQSNIMTRALSASTTNTNFKRTSFSATLAPIPPPKDCDFAISCPDVVKVPERVEPIQIAQPSDDVIPLVPRRSEPEILMHRYISVSSSQGQRLIQPQYTQFPVLHAAPYQKQHIPVYEPQLTVPALSNAPEVSMDCPQPLVDSMTFQRQQLSEDMDIDLDCPQSLMHRLQDYPSSTTESASPSQFTNVVSGFSSSGRSFSYGPRMLPCTWAPHSRGEASLPSPQEPSPVGSCAPQWTSSYAPPVTRTHASQPHVIQPLQDVNATETFAFNVHPDTATPYFGFSQQLEPANPTGSSHAECISTGDMSLDEDHDLSQPVSADHTQMEPIGENVHQPQTQPVSSSDHQPEAVSRPSSPVVTVKAKGDDKHDDGSNSDSDTSDSDYMESSSEDDSDSDDDSGSSEDDEEDTLGPIAGPSKVDKGKGKAL